MDTSFHAKFGLTAVIRIEFDACPFSIQQEQGIIINHTSPYSVPGKESETWPKLSSLSYPFLGWHIIVDLHFGKSVLFFRFVEKDK